MEKTNLPKYIKSYETKIGKITIGSDGFSLTNIFINKNFKNIEEKENKIIKNTIVELNEYFEGNRTSFDIPLNPNGTDFQKKVWNTLLTIPYGTTTSYKNIAEKLKKNKSYRAIGNSNKKNPIPIIIPCHRVINSNGNIGGYFAGIEIKKILLKIENNTFFNN